MMIDSSLRTCSSLGDGVTMMESFYDRGKGMMYDAA